MEPGFESLLGATSLGEGCLRFVGVMFESSSDESEETMYSEAGIGALFFVDLGVDGTLALGVVIGEALNGVASRCFPLTLSDIVEISA